MTKLPPNAPSRAQGASRAETPVRVAGALEPPTRAGSRAATGSHFRRTGATNRFWVIGGVKVTTA
ncbi:hypothetical protein ACIP98_22715 [Streptomyces sp. NPDC088354]|uniref:hypothetical protein n=1 Tax=Streptomyces sp. NPDC088354 TaxID=3365856 RepID=UPI0037F248FF